MRTKINSLIFDFGGVIAAEGFYEGLLAIGRMNCLDPEVFFETVDGLIVETGYLTGRADEATFWNAVREKTRITASDFVLRDEIIKRFTIRPEMIEYADRLRSKGLFAVVLSDHTNWLDEIDQQTGLFQHFDKVFNSFHIHKSKLDATVFRDVCAELNVKPDESLFIDDNAYHIQRAQGEGLNVIHFVGMRDFEKRIREFISIDPKA